MASGIVDRYHYKSTDIEDQYGDEEVNGFDSDGRVRMEETVEGEEEGERGTRTGFSDYADLKYTIQVPVMMMLEV